MSPNHWLTPLLVVNVASAGAVLLLVAGQRRERRRLRAFAQSITNRELDPATVAWIIGREIYRSIKRLDDDPHFLHRALAPLGASPGDVRRHGACCSGISRLYILALDTVGIPAAQVTLCDRDGNGRHCLVEVSSGDGHQLIDPTYGLAYESLDGSPASLAGLRVGLIPRFVSLVDGSEAAYPSSDYYAFDFAATKTANWTRTLLRRVVYRFLVLICDIDGMRLPVAFEWPHALVAGVIAVAALGVDVVAWLG